jgi:hypothetical protein
LLVELSKWSFDETHPLLQETITGQLPFIGKSDNAVMVAIAVRKEVPSRPEEFFPSYSDDSNRLWAMISRCWSPEPKNRPQVSEVQDLVSMSPALSWCVLP